jgi:uncharacterized protein (TIRG00374 family)
MAASPLQTTIARRWSITGLMLLLFAVAVGGAVFVTGWEDVLRTGQTLGWDKILALCGLAALHYVLRAMRWHILVQIGTFGVRLRDTLLHFFAGFALTATPGRVGELVRLRWLQRTTGLGLGRLVPIPFADRAIELAAIIVVIVAALALTNLQSAAVWWLLAISALLVAVACWPAALEAALLQVFRLTGGRKARLFVRLRRIIRRLAPFMRPAVFLPCLAIGIVGWSLEGVAFWVLLQWLGAAEITLMTATAIFLVAVLSGALSGLPGGLGGTEATAVALLLLQGVSADVAILATAIIRITTLWFAVTLGLFVFPLAEVRSGKAP